ncbi:H-type small acid-soluble spore protein [Salinithrix halophila]|uniref:H-type small acid-soluble spore protein n=1 Tax=Salinithrix halophila TaxID=1485204 RepID=A0ABV8JHZ6_9BACL
MDILRARQILESPEKVEVHYREVPIWIQNVNDETETARIYTDDEPDRELVVSVQELHER